MYQKADLLLAQLPPEYKGDLLPEIRSEFLLEKRQSSFLMMIQPELKPVTM